MNMLMCMCSKTVSPFKMQRFEKRIVLQETIISWWWCYVFTTDLNCSFTVHFSRKKNIFSSTQTEEFFFINPLFWVLFTLFSCSVFPSFWPIVGATLIEPHSLGWEPVNRPTTYYSVGGGNPRSPNLRYIRRHGTVLSVEWTNYTVTPL